MTQEQIWISNSIEVKSGISKADFSKNAKFSSLTYNNVTTSKVQNGQYLYEEAH